MRDVEETAGFSRFLMGDFEDVDLTRKTRIVSTPMVVCRVCNHHIPLEGYDLEEHYIVKCTVCKEATVCRINFLLRSRSTRVSVQLHGSNCALRFNV